MDLIITVPFTDDFCLIMGNKMTELYLIKEINSNILSMGMKLKPSKCHIFSVSGGTSKVAPFNIEGTPIPLMSVEQQQFFGKIVFFLGKEADTLDYFISKFSEKLENFDNSSIHQEYKLWIYKNYFLSSIRFLLTVHGLTSTSLQALATV